jgi:hypothetical protein
MKKCVNRIAIAVAAVSMIASAVLTPSACAEEVKISESADGSVRIILDTEDIFSRAGVLFASTEVFQKNGAREVFLNSVTGCVKGKGKIVWGPFSQWEPIQRPSRWKMRGLQMAAKS